MKAATWAAAACGLTLAMAACNTFITKRCYASDNCGDGGSGAVDGGSGGVAGMGGSGASGGAGAGGSGAAGGGSSTCDANGYTSFCDVNELSELEECGFERYLREDAFTLEGGRLVVHPLGADPKTMMRQEFWNEGTAAPTLSTTVTGNFSITARFNVDVLSTPADVSDHAIGEYNGASLVAFERSEPANFVLADLARQQPGDFFGAATWVDSMLLGTTHDFAQYVDPGTATVLMVLCRVGEQVSVLMRPEGVAVTEFETLWSGLAVDHGLPDEIEVGFTTHRWTPSEDLRGLLWDIQVKRDIQSSSECVGELVVASNGACD